MERKRRFIKMKLNINEITFWLTKKLAGKRGAAAVASAGKMYDKTLGATAVGKGAKEFAKKAWAHPVGNFAARAGLDAYVGTKLYKAIRGKKQQQQQEPLDEKLEEVRTRSLTNPMKPAKNKGKKPEFQVKYKNPKYRGIQVADFMTHNQAKDHLSQLNREGMKGIISRGGKPIKEDIAKEYTAMDESKRPTRSGIDRVFRAVTRNGKMDTLAATRHVENMFKVKNVKVQKDKNGKTHVISFKESVELDEDMLTHNCDKVHPGMTCSQWKKMEARKKTPATNNKVFGTPGMSE